MLAKLNVIATDCSLEELLAIQNRYVCQINAVLAVRNVLQHCWQTFVQVIHRINIYIAVSYSHTFFLLLFLVAPTSVKGKYLKGSRPQT